MQKEHYTRITADEINCLIYSYFVDSGMKHSAFTLNAEAHLENSPFFRKHIRRGELVELLIKALLYIEVESHWNQTALSIGCKAGFSLLEPHVCSMNPPTAIPTPPIPDANQELKSDAGSKRKSSSPTENGRNGKRPRVEVESSQLEEQRSTSQVITKAPRVSAGNARALRPVSVDPVNLLKGNTSEVFVCAWNPVYPNMVTSGSKDSKIAIYDLPEVLDSQESYEPVVLLEGLTTMDKGDVTCVHWSPDGNLLAIGTCDAYIRVYTAKGELYIEEPQHKVPMFSLRFSPDGKYLVSASLDGSSALWDVEEKKLVRIYKLHTDCVLNVGWVDEKHFASAGADKDAYLFSVEGPGPIHRFTGHLDEINMVTANPSRTKIATCSDDRTVRIWEVGHMLGDEWPGPTPAPTILVGHKHSVVAHAWCPKKVHDGTELIATASFDGHSRLWDALSGACLYMFKEGERPVFTLNFSPDGRFLATGSGDGKFGIFNVKTGERAYTWKSLKARPGIFDIDWQQQGDGDRIAVALEMGHMAIIDTSKIPELR